jgi:hypothetical protein
LGTKLAVATPDLGVHCSFATDKRTFDDGVSATFRAIRWTASMSRASLAGIPDWLKIVRLDKADWRVSDARVEVAGDNGLLGYIERIHAGRWEILWMADPLRWAYEDSFHSAIHAFSESVRFGGTVLAERERWEVPRSANSSRHVLRQIRISNRGQRPTQLED